MSDFILNFGEWAIDEIQIKCITLTSAIIYYHKYEVNAYDNKNFVNVGFFERKKGITLEQKIEEALDKLVHKLEIENITIKKMKKFQINIV